MRAPQVAHWFGALALLCATAQASDCACTSLSVSALANKIRSDRQVQVEAAEPGHLSALSSNNTPELSRNNDIEANGCVLLMTSSGVHSAWDWATGLLQAPPPPSRASTCAKQIIEYMAQNKDDAATLFWADCLAAKHQFDAAHSTCSATQARHYAENTDMALRLYEGMAQEGSVVAMQALALTHLNKKHDPNRALFWAERQKNQGQNSRAFYQKIKTLTQKQNSGTEKKS